MIIPQVCKVYKESDRWNAPPYHEKDDICDTCQHLPECHIEEKDYGQEYAKAVIEGIINHPDYKPLNQINNDKFNQKTNNEI